MASNTGDLDLWISLWADDGTRMAPSAPPQIGRDQIREAVKPVFDVFDLDMTVHMEEAKVDGDLGLTRSSYSLTLTPKAGGDPIVFDPDGKALSVYARQADGSWKIVHDCLNTNVAPSQPQCHIGLSTGALSPVLRD
ncbi:MAG: YybH family protein [Anaerolineae bacterium]